MCVFVCVVWGCLCTQWSTCVKPPSACSPPSEGAGFLKCGADFKPQAPIKEKSSRLAQKSDSPTLKLHTQPQLELSGGQSGLSPHCFGLRRPRHLWSTYPCRCRGCGPRRCRSCIPALYGGHRDAFRGSPGSAGRRTPCSSRSRPGWSSRLGGRPGAPPGTHTPRGSRRSPATPKQRTRLIKTKNWPWQKQERRSHTGSKRDKSLTHVAQITGIPEGVGVCAQLKHRLNTQHCRKPHKGNCNPQSPSAWHSPGI